MSRIRVRLKPQNGIKVRTQTTYLYDPTIIDAEVQQAKDWAIKTDGLVEEEGEGVDYSAKAYATGGTGTETNNAKYYAEQAGISETNASNSATSASGSASSASSSASLAKDWATKTDGTVDGVDYSSKYYAQQITPIATDITTVAGIASNVTTVAGISSNVTSVAGNATNINKVASDINRVNLVADDIDSVHTVAVDISTVIDVANNKTNIDAVAGDLTNIDAVAANENDIDTVASNITAVSNVGDNIGNVNTVAADSANIATVVNNITAINAAPTYAAQAKQWAIGEPSEPANGSAKYWADRAHVYTEGVLKEDLISNCITEIPQDIKLEVNNGTLTLKSGSVITAPNGTQYTTLSDFTINPGTPTGQRAVFIGITSGGIMSGYVGVNGVSLYSGATAPTPIAQTSYWLDTTNSVIKRTQDTGSTWAEIPGITLCLPVCLVTFNAGTLTSIDQVFNGAGYIGHHAFVLPGVKCLAPDGRNADGTLKSYSIAISSLCIKEMVNTTTSTGWLRPFSFFSRDIFNVYPYRVIKKYSELIQQSASLQYVEEDNLVYVYSSSSNSYNNQHWIPVVEYNYNGTTVTKFDIRQPVRLATTEMTDNLQTQVDGKLDKVTSITSGYQLYQKNPDGTQSLRDVVQGGVSANTVPVRTSTGTIRTATPTDNNDATNKSYVDTALQGKANTSLNNLDSTGQMVIDSQNGTISNCILDIPQDINLTLSNGALTLKSGSVITRPNGSQYQTTQEQSSGISVGSGSWVGYIIPYNTNGIIQEVYRYVTSGSSFPQNPATHAIHYDTTNNKIYMYSTNAQTWNETNMCLPIAKVTVTSGVITSIDQIFNGAGYIGISAFVLPGVKGLIPTGFNSDGTLKSSVINNQALRIYTASNATGKRYWLLRNSNVQDTTDDYVEAEYNDGTHVRGYYYKNNYVENANGIYYTDRLFFATITYSNGVITSIDIRQPVRLATTEMLDTKANDSEVVKLAGNQTIAGTKTFSSTITGSISGNAGTVTNGVYTTGTQTITGNKTFSGSVALGSSATATTQAATDNSTKVATTGFIGGKFQVVSNLPATPEVGVFYFISEE